MEWLWICLWLCRLLSCDADLIYDDAAFIPLSLTGCYKWYTKMISVDGTPFPSFEVPPFNDLEVRVWVADPLSYSQEEQHNTATIPSLTSMQLTTLFYNLGETPNVSFFSDISPSKPLVEFVGYNTSGNYWLFTLSTQASILIPVIIKGNDISILGCAIMPQQFSLSIQVVGTTTTLNIISGTNASLTINSMGKYIRHTDPCSPNIAVIVMDSSSSFIFTQDNFVTTQLVSFTNALLDGEVIVDIAPMKAGFVVLIQSALYYVPLEEGSTPVLPQGIPSPFIITHIQISPNCDQLEYNFNGAQEVDTNCVVFAWDDTTRVFQFYVSVDCASSFNAVEITEGSHIYSIALLPNNPYYLLLVNSSMCQTTQLCVLMYNYKYSTWKLGGNIPYNGSESARELEISIPATGADILYIWGTLADVYYSADGGMTLQLLNFLDNSDEGIVAFASSPIGRIAMLTGTGRTLYGLTDVPTNSVVGIVNPLSPHAFIDFDPFGNLVTITLSPTGVLVNTSDILGELSSSFDPCPFVDLSTDFPPYYYIDMNEVAIVMINFTLPSPQPTQLDSNMISMALSNTALFNFNMAFLGSNIQTLFTTYQYAIALSERDANSYSSYADRVANAQGNTDVRIIPNAYSLRCPFVQKIQRVQVGCPPYRSLVVSTDGTLPTCSTCAVSQYYGSLFRPILMVNDNGKLTEVLVDFVLWEIYGRTDYSFNLTTHQAGCIVPAQTTEDFPAIKLEDGTLDRNWKPATYHSCFIGTPTKVPDNPYEVINASAYNNAVIFLGGGQYTFRVRVVDPMYSYCDLTADVIVQVYGAPLSGGYSALIVICTSLVIAASLLLSYLTYKKTHKIHEL